MKNKNSKHVPYHYAEILKKWREGAGPIPSRRVIESVHKSGLVKPGSKDAFALAMTMRPLGATQSQITCVLGQPHRNKIKTLLQKGDVEMVPIIAAVICKVAIKRK